MKEIVLRHFFEGHASAHELRLDAVGMRYREGPDRGPHVYRYDVVPMGEEFELRPKHLVMLLDALEGGTISARDVEDLASWLEGAVDRFLRDVETQDGERVAEALFLLANPDINYPLTPRVLGKIRHYLTTGEKTLSRADLKPAPSTRLSNER